MTSVWKYPDEGTCKINGVATFDKLGNTSHFGVVARNCRGEVIKARCGSSGMVETILHAETVAVWQAVIMAINLPFLSVQIETDCMELVLELNSNDRSFTSCGLLIDHIKISLGRDDEQQSVDGSQPNLPIRNIVFDVEDEEVCCKLGGGERNFKKRHKNRKEGKLNISSPTLVTPMAAKKSSISRENGSEEGFIVFCFKEGGEFDVVKDGSGKKLIAANNDHPDSAEKSNARRVNRKLKFGEEMPADNENRQEETTAENQCEDSSKNEGEKKENIYSDIEPPFTFSSARSKQYYTEETENRGLVCAESRDSNQSDGSTGSFAFPVLRWEWIGSPVRMPRSEDIHLRKHRARIQCYTY
ncbi:hypothetical protein ACFE04_005312 [Oxalis oulophora]